MPLANDFEPVNIGDFGCTDVDTEEWAKQNRVRLYRGKVNRWLLARTLRDNPDPDDIRSTLNAVMSKWFDGVGIDPGLAAALESEGIVGEVVDGVRIVKASRLPITIPAIAERREDLKYPPLPVINLENPAIFLDVQFNYRGLAESIAWPVRTAPGIFGVQLQSSAMCPIGCDWLLLASGAPEADAPERKDWGDIFKTKAKDIIKEAASPIIEDLDKLKTPLYVGAALFGVYLTYRIVQEVKRR